METAVNDKVTPAAERLVALVSAIPPDPRRDKVLYHLDRLQKAFHASHQEAVRFAAFTENKTIHDASDWRPEIAAAMAALRTALAEAGHDFLKGN